MTNVDNIAEPTMTKLQMEFHNSVEAVYKQADASDKASAASIADGDDPRYEKISPLVAAVLVKLHNQKNRDVSISKVYGYRDAMNRGEWKLNHQGIAFYPNNTIADGQHRMYALALSDVSQIKFMVSPNFDNHAIDTIDLGKSRNAGDALAMIGYADAKLKGTISKSAMNILHMIEQGTSMKNITVQQVEKFVERWNAELDWAIALGRSSVKQVSEACLSERESAEAALLLKIGGYPNGYISGYIAALQQGMAPYANAPHTDITRKLVKAKYADRNKDKLNAMQKYALLLKGAYFAATEQGVSKVAWDKAKESFPTNRPPTIASFDDIEEAA
jgi:hypothetical protein